MKQKKELPARGNSSLLITYSAITGVLFPVASFPTAVYGRLGEILVVCVEDDLPVPIAEEVPVIAILNTAGSFLLKLTVRAD